MLLHQLQIHNIVNTLLTLLDPLRLSKPIPHSICKYLYATLQNKVDFFLEHIVPEEALKLESGRIRVHFKAVNLEQLHIGGFGGEDEGSVRGIHFALAQ